MNITILSGSPRANSLSYRVALYLEQHLQTSTPHQVRILDVRNWNLPLLQHVFQSVESTPEPFRALSEVVFGTDAFLLVTPEYNGSYSPAMKNLMDHFPKQARKPMGIVTASPGGMGGMRAAMQMQQWVAAMFGILSPHMLIVPHVEKKFDEQGKLTDEGYSKTVDTFLSEFLWLAESLENAKTPAL